VAVFIVVGVVTLAYAFQSGNDAASEVEVIYTYAAETLAAQQQTLQAGVPSATPTLLVLTSPTVTATSLASPTLGGLPSVFSTATSGGASTCDNSVYIKDVTIPDGTIIGPGQAFTKTWQVSNTGTCTWSATYQIILISGDAMSGKATAIGKIVGPGQSADVSVALTAPATTGALKGTWRLQNDKSQPFGTLLTVEIKVGAVTGTPGTATVTSTNSSGSGATSTPTVTLTTAPANTATSTTTNVPTPTNTPETPVSP
jgi:hypothetical protein